MSAIIAGSGVLPVAVIEDKCPFCEELFVRDERYEKFGLVPPIEAHIMSDHRKVRVSRGNDVKWVDEN